MKEPTETEIREFWEGCGFWYDTNQTRGLVHDIGWRDPEGHILGGCRIFYLPPLDLKSLFEFAVPVAIAKIMEQQDCDLELATHILFKKWLQHMEFTHDFVNPLFWAIWEVVK